MCPGQAPDTSGEEVVRLLVDRLTGRVLLWVKGTLLVTPPLTRIWPWFECDASTCASQDGAGDHCGLKPSAAANEPFRLSSNCSR